MGSRANFGVVALAFALVSVGAGCGLGQQLVASAPDHEDYRAVRMAAHPGTRLARARAYLERHPRGTYAAEVQKLYEAEEPAYFARAKETPDGAREYLASLPGGPHAEAASAVLRGAYERAEDIAVDRELREGRIAEVRFERARAKRKAITEASLDALAAIADAGVLGARVDAPPATLVRAVHGPGGSLSGMPRSSERDLFFSLPAAVGRHDADRVLTLKAEIDDRERTITRVSLSGADWFVRWYEAETNDGLDPTSAADRKKARDRALEVVAGALEARAPARRCEREAKAPVVLVRACDGVRITVVSTATWGGDDRITLERAPGAGAGDPPVASPKGNE